MRTVRVLKTFTGKAHPPWGIYDSDDKSFLGSYPSKSEALYVVEEEGYVLKSDTPTILGPEIHHKGPTPTCYLRAGLELQMKPLTEKQIQRYRIYL